MRKFIIIATLLLSSKIFSTPTEMLSAIALFDRCYFQITGDALTKSHPLYSSVENGSLSYDQACTQVLSKGFLNSSGSNIGKLKTVTDEGKKVISHLLHVHRQWIGSQDLVAAIDGPGSTRFVYDDNDPALNLTRILLTPEIKYDQLFKTRGQMEAIRSNGCDPDDTFSDIHFVSDTETSYRGDTQPLMLSFVQTGELLGVRPMELGLDVNDENCLSTPKKDQSVNFAYTGPNEDRYNRINGNIKIHKPIGDGVFSTRTYIIHNHEYPFKTSSDGGLKMFRRWSESLIKEFLCRELPVVRQGDAVTKVQTTNITQKTPPFRTNARCMECHSTIDPMAATIRNIWLHRSRGSMASLVNTPVTSDSESSDFINEDIKYYTRPPAGHFFFRGYDGTLHNKKVSNVSELSHYISGIKDPYVCAASRYFKYFTGIDVPISDFADSEEPSIGDAAYRQIVVSLGEDFYQHKSPEKLIEKIISHPVYKTKAFRLKKD